MRAIAVIMVIVLALSGTVLAQDKSLAELVAENEQLSTFNTLVEQAGLTLSGTVYAPTDDAFIKLPEFVINYIADDAELLAAVLNYHVAAEGSALTIVVNEDGSVIVDNANVVEGDIAATDGVLNLIDTVLVPAIELPEVIPADVSGSIALAGSSTVFPISQTISADFSAEGFAGEVTADSIGTGAGFERFCAAEGASDIANASRPIKESEIEACAANNGRDPIGFLVGTDGVAIVAHPSNDFATDLTAEELVLAFSTAVTWADVRAGFPDCAIQRWIPGTDSGTFDFFTEIVFAKDSAPSLAASNLSQSEDDNVLLEGVASNECAIGYFGYAYYAENSDKLSLVAFDGVQPNADSVNDGSYKLARPLYIYTAASVIEANPAVADYLVYYLNRVPEVTPSVGYYLPEAFSFNSSKLLLLALIAEAGQ